MSRFDTVERMVEDRRPFVPGEDARTEDEDAVSLCAIQMGGLVLGIETSMVREVLGRTMGGLHRELNVGMQARHLLRSVPLAPAYVAGVMAYRGEVLTTLSLRVLLGEEPTASGGCVLVLDDVETGERIGLMVDAVSGVVTVGNAMREANPFTLDARSRALFDGVYKTATGLVVRIDPTRLSPGKLAGSGLFAERAVRGGSGCVR